MANTVKIKPSVDELYEALDDAMYHVKACMDALKGIDDYEGWYALMEEVLGEMKFVLVPVEALVDKHYADEMAVMTRDYYRSVL